MTRSTKLASTVLLYSLSVAVAFAIGNASGLYFYPKFFTATEAEDAHDHDHEAELAEVSDHEEEEDHVALSKQAFDNLNLQLGSVTRGDYWVSRTVPGEVIEVPGKSELSVPAPVSGVVERVLVRQGQAIRNDERIAELRITDEELTQSQSKLLSTLARQDVVREEISRLEPLTNSGTVSGTKKRNLEYELKQLVADERTNMQEIRVRGLPETVLESIVDGRRLADKLFVTLPDFSDPAYLTHHVSVDAITTTSPLSYSVEQLEVHPGKTVKRGDSLCSLAFHSELHIRGTAFESDLPILEQLVENDWKLTAEFGHVQHEGHVHREKLDGLSLLHVNNHANAKSQTFDFFVPIQNEVKRSTTDSGGRAYQQWRFKPGQRVHLRLPVEQWKDQLLLPNDAVVVEGPNAFVFVEHVHEEASDHPHDAHEDAIAHSDHDHAHSDHDHDDHSQHDHDEDDHESDVFVELEPVPVRLLHRDSETSVIADDGQLHGDDRIALNNAFKLHLAMEMQGGGGGGHHHHDH